jgi:phosphoenolpyruvate---glycerone phosphotransferase subunit DhaK
MGVRRAATVRIHTMRASVPTSKKLINSPDTVVQESLAGFARAYEQYVRVDLEQRIVVSRDAPRTGKVGIVSGGGSGHEPLDCGFVGPGMLDAACLGEIFTSPAPGPIIEASRAVDGGVGVLYVVKTYTGDVMNFRLAADAAAELGIDVEVVFTSDDIATGSPGHEVARRGTGLTPIVQKLVGARAESGASLTDVADLARAVNQAGRSVGVALSSHVTPALGRPTFELGPDEIEFGVGIHGEPGRRREKLASAEEIVERMVDELLGELQVVNGSALLAFVNGFGATPLLELYIVYGELVRALEQRGLEVTRRLVGNYMTSLEMAGVSITLLPLDDELTALWDAPVATVGLRW